MTLMSAALEHRRLRAPSADGGRLIEPPLRSVGDLFARNIAAAAEYDYDVQGRPLVQLAAQARAELIEAAWNYTRAYRDVARPTLGPSAPVLLAGHQPQLFHPGVWFKNFVLADVARWHGGVAVNLAIDSDTVT